MGYVICYMTDCPICKSNKTRHYFSNGTLTLQYCSRCKVRFQHPMPAADFLNKLYSSEYYEAFYPERILGEQKLLFLNRLNMLERMNGGQKGKCLDVGSGQGMFLEAALERGWECIGQEFSQDASKSIQNRLGVDVIVCNNIKDAGFTSNSFDLVNMNHVLEHLYNPVETINEIYRILKPGGLFYCEVPRQNNFLNYLSNIFGKKDFGFNYKPVHLFIFDIQTISFLFKQTEFKPVSLKIEGIGAPHRYVYGRHYTSLWTYIVVWMVKKFRLEVLFGGGNLAVIACKRKNKDG